MEKLVVFESSEESQVMKGHCKAYEVALELSFDGEVAVAEIQSIVDLDTNTEVLEADLTSEERTDLNNLIFEVEEANDDYMREQWEQGRADALYDAYKIGEF